MWHRGRLFVLIAALVIGVQCSKKGGTGIQKELPFGQSVQLQPVGLPVPPAGMLYEAWTFRLEKSGGTYAAKLHSFQKFGWNDYAYKFIDPQTGADLGDLFQAAADSQNLFTTNQTPFMRADSISMLLEKLLRGERVTLSGDGLDLTGMVGFLLSVEPENETGADTALPKSPFLVGISNDSGIVTMSYPIDYRGPDVTPGYFLASPSDSLITLCPCEINDSLIIRNEARGVWLGQFDTTRTERGRGAGSPDPVLTQLSRGLLPGWEFAAWLKRGNYPPIHIGCFFRADSADLCNPYVLNPDSVFPFPGEDFFTNPPPGALDGNNELLGAALLITLEPARPYDNTIFPMVLFQDTLPRTYASEPDREGERHRNIQYNFVMQNRAHFLPKMRLRILPEARK